VNKQNKIEFLKLYKPIHEQFGRFCRAISGNINDTDDLIQDSLLSVMERFGEIKDKSAFKAYLFSVASNLHKMKLRRLKFKAHYSDEEAKQIIDFSQDSEWLTDFNLIYEKILSLPQKTAETIILYHISDLSLKEIQKIQGGSLSGVKLRLKRGRKKILNLLNTPEQVKMALMLLAF